MLIQAPLKSPFRSCWSCFDPCRFYIFPVPTKAIHAQGLIFSSGSQRHKDFISVTIINSFKYKKPV